MEFLILNRDQLEQIKPEIPYVVIGATELTKSKPVVFKNKWYMSDDEAFNAYYEKHKTNIDSTIALLVTHPVTNTVH